MMIGGGETYLVNALQLTAYLSVPVLAAVIIAALCAGAFRVVTQIEDGVIGFFARFVAVAALFWFSATFYAGELFSFAERMWSGADNYH